MSDGLSSLPASVRELVELIGLQTAMKLVRHLGGTTYPVPKALTPQGRRRYDLLADIVGTEAADALVKRYGGVGDGLYIPRCAAALQAARDAAINEYFVAETNKGRSSAQVVFQLARRYRLSDRRIWLILKTLPEKPSEQLRLF